MENEDVKVWDLFNGSAKSPEELSESRLKICRSCEFFKPKFNKCSKCGCFMKLKTSLLDAKCPIKKW